MKFKIIILSLIFQLFLWEEGTLLAHPMPNSLVILNVHENSISGEIQLPLSELQSAIGNNVNVNSEKLIERFGEFFKKYIIEHIKPKTLDGKPWKFELGDINLVVTKSKLSGEYKELLVGFTMSPPMNYDLRNFYLYYDIILHNVASHKAIIAIKQDWQQGIVREDSSVQEVGVIEWDIVNNNLKPFQVSLDQGSTWKGLKSMFLLGKIHIAEGTDHLLFLLVLLIPIPLLVSQNKWGSNRPFRQSLNHILKIVTAFTIGHSITLLFGALGWVLLPSKWIEVLIGVSIFISAFHAIKPIFPKKETYVALGFGLIHGLAFADSLKDLNLNTTKLVFSILSFNVGIEIMQIAIIITVMPWFLLLAKSNFYTIIRIFFAFIAIILSLAWILERISEKPNGITENIQAINEFYWFFISFLILLTFLSNYFSRKHIP